MLRQEIVSTPRAQGNRDVVEEEGLVKADVIVEVGELLFEMGEWGLAAKG